MVKYTNTYFAPLSLLIGIALRNVCSLRQAKHCGVLFLSYTYHLATTINSNSNTLEYEPPQSWTNTLKPPFDFFNWKTNHKNLLGIQLPQQKSPLNRFFALKNYYHTKSWHANWNK